VRTSGALTPVNQIRPLRIAASQSVDSEPRTIEETISSCCSRHGHRPAPSPTQSIQCTPYPAQGIGSKLRIVEMTNISRCSRHRPRLAPSQNSQAPTHNSGTRRHGPWPTSSQTVKPQVAHCAQQRSSSLARLPDDASLPSPDNLSLTPSSPLGSIEYQVPVAEKCPQTPIN
jgi:hypothetical protein